MSTFLPNPDDELEEGGVLVYSELKLLAKPEPSSGERARRITTVHTSHGTTVREQNLAAPAGRVAARIAYTDDSGSHTHDVTTDSVMIGRAAAYPVDIRIASSPDVSREHARIRRDPKTGAFYLIDLSSFGTTLNARHVPIGSARRRTRPADVARMHGIPTHVRLQPLGRQGAAEEPAVGVDRRGHVDADEVEVVGDAPAVEVDDQQRDRQAPVAEEREMLADRLAHVPRDGEQPEPGMASRTAWAYR